MTTTNYHEITTIRTDARIIGSPPFVSIRLTVSNSRDTSGIGFFVDLTEDIYTMADNLRDLANQLTDLKNGHEISIAPKADPIEPIGPDAPWTVKDDADRE